MGRERSGGSGAERRGGGGAKGSYAIGLGLIWMMVPSGCVISHATCLSGMCTSGTGAVLAVRAHGLVFNMEATADYRGTLG